MSLQFSLLSRGSQAKIHMINCPNELNWQGLKPCNISFFYFPHKNMLIKKRKKEKKKKEKGAHILLPSQNTSLSLSNIPFKETAFSQPSRILSQSIHLYINTHQPPIFLQDFIPPLENSLCFSDSNHASWSVVSHHN